MVGGVCAYHHDLAAPGGARRWRSLLVLALLVALATATVLAAAAGARRGQTAFDRLWASTLPATVTVLPNQPGFDWDKVRALPEVAVAQRVPGRVRVLAGLLPGREHRVPAHRRRADPDPGTAGHARPGGCSTPAVPTRSSSSPQFVAANHKSIGDTLTLHLATPQQVNEGFDGSTGPPLGPRIKARIVGVGRGVWVSATSDGPGKTGSVLASPALFDRYRANILGTNGRPTSTR